MQFGDMKVGPKLYIKRVLIMDHCESLMPPYLRFVKGVVDSADLPLNVSRELLQQNPLLEKIQKNVVKSILKALAEMKTSEYDKYVTFFKALGDVLKEGISRDWSNREQIADLLLVESTRTEPDKYTTLAEYAGRMPSSQTEIYYLIGEQRSLIEHAPYLEVFRERGWEVLLLTDPIDEFVLPSLTEYKGKKLKAADKSEIEEAGKSPTEENRKKFASLFEAMKTTIDEVKEIRLSSRLRESAACLVSEEGAIGAHMERLLRRAGHLDAIGDTKRILEINPEHPAVLALKNLYETRPDDPRIASYSRLLYEEAVIAEGSKLKDPVGFARRVNDLLVKDAQA
jgi:molecular chaperone HtpG